MAQLEYGEPLELINEFSDYILTILQKNYSISAIERLRSPIMEWEVSNLYQSYKTMFEVTHRKEAEISDLVMIGLHGTDPANIDSILAKGLLSPQDEAYKMKHGNAHGPGVYTTTSESYSSSYGCVLVLAIIPGNNTTIRKDYDTGEFDSITSSHITVLRSSRQVCPLFKVKFGKGDPSIYDCIPVISHPPNEAVSIAAYIQDTHPEIRLDIIIGIVIRGKFETGSVVGAIVYTREALDEFDYTG